LNLHLSDFTIRSGTRAEITSPKHEVLSSKF
jgi:hypothetical protein